MKLRTLLVVLAILVVIVVVFELARRPEKARPRSINLPSSKALYVPAPGHPQPTNSFPTAVTLSPNGGYLAILNNGYGTEQSDFQQSIAILDLSTHKVTDYPDSRLGQRAGQTYYLGLAFSHDGSKLYASMSSLTDPLGKKPNDTGNGIAVYTFEGGRLTPDRFIKIPLAPLARDKKSIVDSEALPKGMAISYPAGLAVLPGAGGEKLLVAENLADDAIVLDTKSGKVLQRFPLSTAAVVPAAFPYGVTAMSDGKTGFCSLWNASAIAQLDLETGKVIRRIPLLEPKSPVAAGSHPTAMLLSPDQKYLYVTLTNSDRVAVVDVEKGEVAGLLSTELPEQQYGGSYPDALAQSADGKKLYVAGASTDAVAVFDMSNLGAHSLSIAEPQKATGFIPTEWYPTALATDGNSLMIVTGKGEGSGPNAGPLVKARPRGNRKHPYIAALMHGSVAVADIGDIQNRLADLTHEVELSNLMQAKPKERVLFNGDKIPIHHVIYIIKENRTYDQVFGDLKPGNADPSLVMYGEEITPNQHALARQFGIIDNFYCSGEVSGDGHVWSMAAITSDYNERTWQIGYRSGERTYDFEGQVLGHNPLAENIPDVDEPGTGFIWANVARNGLTHRNYGEFVTTHWCDAGSTGASPKAGTPLAAQGACRQKAILPGQPLPSDVGDPRGSASPWPWPVPMIAYDEATKPELQGNFDPKFADFRLDYPDQLRADEFLNELGGFVKARQAGQGETMPQFIILRLPNDHTAGTSPGMPTPSASVADNDLAVGRVVEAVSQSPYWDDTAIFILEDDAQDGPDHVDAHRSTMLVISKYSQGSSSQPFVDHDFYTTVSTIRTMEALLALPPMNINDAQAPVMVPEFAGPGNQPAFTADYRNQKNGLIYQMNSPKAPGARGSARMDFVHADQANTAELNRILWRNLKGNVPMPQPRHVVFR
ncbi:MAG TPA: beta-propeller fold lactonase family protein [Terriglobia bacterium]|nr:beta-propeller fold lactonase family protein [Terriglobia bacterium]